MRFVGALTLALACCLCVAAMPVEEDNYADLIMPVDEEQADVGEPEESQPAPEESQRPTYGFYYMDHEGNLKPLPIPQGLAELLTHLLQPRFDPAGLIFNEHGIFYTDWQGNLHPLPLPEKFIKLLALLWKPQKPQPAGLTINDQGIFYVDHEGNLIPLPQKLSELLALLMSHFPQPLAPQTRFTCDVLSFSILGTKFNHSACAMHCKWINYRGGHCNKQGVCICRD